MVPYLATVMYHVCKYKNDKNLLQFYRFYIKTNGSLLYDGIVDQVTLHTLSEQEVINYLSYHFAYVFML